VLLVMSEEMEAIAVSLGCAYVVRGGYADNASDNRIAGVCIDGVCGSDTFNRLLFSVGLIVLLGQDWEAPVATSGPATVG
jgi:hypothetical protein